MIQSKAFETNISRNNKKTSKLQEKRIANKINGVIQPASGALDFAKGDVVIDDFLFECKRTEKKSIKIESKWLEKIWREALAKNKNPALTIEIGGMKRPVSRDWVVIPIELFREKFL